MWYVIAYLTVIEGSINGKVVDVGVHDRRHLSLLHGADLAVGVHDKDGDILLPSQSVDGGRTSISTCSANDGQMLPVASDLALVPPHKEVFE